jgi:hypothetical protein
LQHINLSCVDFFMNRLYFLGGKGMRIAWNDEEAALGRLF